MAAGTRPRFAWPGVTAVVAADALIFAVTIERYGYHRDELYFRMLASHPGWGYVDQPPGTPVLARLGMAVLGDDVRALRVPAALFALATVVVTARLQGTRTTLLNCLTNICEVSTSHETVT